MTRRRWIADECSAGSASLTGAHAAHLARTLRARIGQEFEVACGEKVYRATVNRVADDRVEFTLGEEVASHAVVPITLLLAVFKFDRMEWAIEKCTELNVTTVVPVIARRTEKHLAQAAEKRLERWRRIAREASEQSRRTIPPEITAALKLTDALAALGGSDYIDSVLRDFSGKESVLSAMQDAVRRTEPRSGGAEFSPGRKPWVNAPNALSPVGTAQNRTEHPILGPPDSVAHLLRIVLAETERDITLSEVLRAQDDVRSLTLAIGPEGGWSPEELQSFATAQFVSCSLGDTILRAETAAMAALAIARSAL